MTKKKVWRYYCSFCKKANCSGASISRHESRCTKNPNRTCRMCKFLGETQPNLQDLINLLPNPKDYEITENNYGVESTHLSGKLTDKMEEILPELRNKSNNCPCCILAALRQRGIPVPMTNFNFKEECESVFKEKNEQDRENDERATYY